MQREHTSGRLAARMDAGHFSKASSSVTRRYPEESKTILPASYKYDRCPVSGILRWHTRAPHTATTSPALWNFVFLQDHEASQFPIKSRRRRPLYKDSPKEGIKVCGIWGVMIKKGPSRRPHATFIHSFIH